MNFWKLQIGISFILVPFVILLAFPNIEKTIVDMIALTSILVIGAFSLSLGIEEIVKELRK